MIFSIKRILYKKKINVSNILKDTNIHFSPLKMIEGKVFSYFAPTAWKTHNCQA